MLYRLRLVSMSYVSVLGLPVSVAQPPMKSSVVSMVVWAGYRVALWKLGSIHALLTSRSITLARIGVTCLYLYGCQWLCSILRCQSLTLLRSLLQTGCGYNIIGFVMHGFQDGYRSKVMKSLSNYYMQI